MCHYLIMLCSCTYCLMSCMASSYFIPLSIRANATSTGALCSFINKTTVMSEHLHKTNLCVMSRLCYLPSPATQWTATQHPGSSWNFFFSRLSQSSTSLLGGGAPSSNGQSWGRNICQIQHSRQRDKCELCVGVSHHHVDAIFLQWRFIVGDVTHTNHCGGSVALQILKWEKSLTVRRQLDCQHLEHQWYNFTNFLKLAFTSINELRVLSVGLCVIRNLMFLWHSSTGAGRFIVATG